MRIFSKRAYRFTLYGPKGEKLATADVEPHAIKPVPDWVKDDRLFKMALKAGNVSIIGTAGNANIDAVDAVIAEAKSLGIQNPGAYTLDRLRETISEIKGRPPGESTGAAVITGDGGNKGDGKPGEDDDPDNKDNFEPVTDKPLAEKSVKEMRTLAKEKGITIPRGTDGDGIRKMLADAGVK